MYSDLRCIYTQIYTCSAAIRSPHFNLCCGPLGSPGNPRGSLGSPLKVPGGSLGSPQKTSTRRGLFGHWFCIAFCHFDNKNRFAVDVHGHDDGPTRLVLGVTRRVHWGFSGNPWESLAVPLGVHRWPFGAPWESLGVP
jgi:hypothetical protein